MKMTLQFTFQFTVQHVKYYSYRYVSCLVQYSQSNSI